MINYANENRCHGVALIMVLLFVGVIAIVGLGFIVRGDAELACGNNTATKAAMDYLAESGLEHARGLILNPQDVDDEYWPGDTGLQLEPGSSDYYDVSVARLSYCNYQIISTAYRLESGQRIAQSRLMAELRLDPCIALRTGNSWESESITTVYGDAYSKGNLTGFANIYGDAYAKNSATAFNVLGSETGDVDDSDPPVPLLDIDVTDYQSLYSIDGVSYSVDTYASDVMNDIVLGPTAGNPAGVYYHDGDLVIDRNVTINGTLVVKGHVEIYDENNTITAAKNFPAIIVNNKLKMYDGSRLTVNGLAWIKDELEGYATVSTSLTINGALFIKDHNIDGMELPDNSITVRAYPDKAAVKLWSDSSSYTKWSPASGAFYKSIERISQ